MENVSRAQLESWYMIMLAVPVSQAGSWEIATETAPIGTRHVDRGSDADGAIWLGVFAVEVEEEGEAALRGDFAWE